MSRFFTSDLHLGSSNINRYAKRPFVSAQDAVTSLTKNINDKVESTDTLIHVGDFVLLGHDRHDAIEDAGLDYDVKDYLRMLECRTFLIEGNHDSGHNCEADAKSIMIDLNQNYRNVTVGHYPSTSQVIKKSWSGRTVFTKHSVNGYQGMCGNSNRIHIHLCGHIHSNWLLNYDAKHNILNVNVGVDVWDYRPVRDSEITEMLDFIFANGSNLFTMKEPGFVAWNRDRYNKWVLKVNKELAAAREQRRKEKLERKGLTPEECERRKQEGIKLSKIKKLHMMTGAGMEPCKDALEECGYDDLKKAKAWLEEHGLNIAKKSTRKAIGYLYETDDRICQVWSPKS